MTASPVSPMRVLLLKKKILLGVGAATPHY
jgi:hypothetical protein